MKDNFQRHLKIVGSYPTTVDAFNKASTVPFCHASEDIASPDTPMNASGDVLSSDGVKMASEDPKFLAVKIQSKR